MAADLRVDPPDRASPSESAGLPLVGAGIRTWASCLCTLILIKLPFSLDIMPFEAWMMTGLPRGQVGVLQSCLQCNSRDNETCLLFKYCFFTVKVRGQHARRTLTAFIWDGISTNKVETHQEV